MDGVNFWFHGKESAETGVLVKDYEQLASVVITVMAIYGN